MTTGPPSGLGSLRGYLRLAAWAVSILLLAMVARLLGSSAWLWVGLMGALFLGLYARLGGFAFLALGAFLTASGVGILLEAIFNWSGAYLTSVGTGIAMLELFAPKPSRWALWVGGALAVLGLLLGIYSAQGRGLLLLCLLAAGAAAYLASARRYRAD